jgi:hypothetical protein
MKIERKQTICSQCGKDLSKVEWVSVEDGTLGHFEFCSRRCYRKHLSTLRNSQLKEKQK